MPEYDGAPGKRRRSFLSQLWRFGQVGVVGFIANAGIVELMAHLVGPVWAQVIAFPIAATLTWYLNRRYTFGASGRKAHHEWLRYFLSNTLGWGANNASYFILVFHSSVVFEHPAIGVAAGSVAGLSFNFLMSRLFVFDQSRD